MLIPDPGVLLQRVADSLESDVVHELAPSYQRTEVEATVLLLRNLAGRVAWRETDLAEDLDVSTALVALLGGQDSSSAERADFAALVDRRAELGTRIDEVYDDAVGAPDRLAELRAALREMVDREEDRNRAGVRLIEPAP